MPGLESELPASVQKPEGIFSRRVVLDSALGRICGPFRGRDVAQGLNGMVSPNGFPENALPLEEVDGRGEVGYADVGG